MSPRVNGTGMCTSLLSPYAGCQPRMTTGQKARFLRRSALAAPYLSSVLHPSSKEVKGNLDPDLRILNHGLTSNKDLLQKCKKIFFYHTVINFGTFSAILLHIFLLFSLLFWYSNHEFIMTFEIADSSWISCSAFCFYSLCISVWNFLMACFQAH